MEKVFSHLKWVYSKVAFYLISSLWCVELWRHGFERSFFLSGLLYLSFLGLQSTNYYLYALQSLAFFGMIIETQDLSFGALGLFPFIMMLLHHHCERQESELEEDESYFKHDFLNHFHELKLFLEHKLGTNRALAKEDIQILLKNLNQMQGTFCSHYDIQLKESFDKNENLIDCDELIHSCNHLVKNYFSNPFLNKVETHYLFEKNAYPLSSCYLDQGKVLRIVGNILKNIHEYDSREIHITYCFDQSFLKILFKNSLEKSQRTDERYLSKAILSKDGEERRGLGLASVQKLCESMGGEFSFRLLDQEWMSEVTLPFSEVVSKNYKLSA